MGLGFLVFLKGFKIISEEMRKGNVTKSLLRQRKGRKERESLRLKLNQDYAKMKIAINMSLI